jgi:hypothetical protein
VERKLTITFELIVGLLKKKISGFNSSKESGFSSWQYMRIDELQSSVVVACCWRCGWLIVSGARPCGLCCLPSVRREGREMKWGRDKDEKGEERMIKWWKREHCAFF